MEQGETIGPIKAYVEGVCAEIVTTTMLDIHLSDEIMKPTNATTKKMASTNDGMAEPLVQLKATVKECVSLDVDITKRERSLTLELWGD